MTHIIHSNNDTLSKDYPGLKNAPSSRRGWVLGPDGFESVPAAGAYSGRSSPEADWLTAWRLTCSLVPHNRWQIFALEVNVARCMVWGFLFVCLYLLYVWLPAGYAQIHWASLRTKTDCVGFWFLGNKKWRMWSKCVSFPVFITMCISYFIFASKHLV